MKRMRIVLLLAPLILMLTGCGGKWILYYDKELNGQIVDGETGRPIDDALVVGLWKYSDWFGEGPGGYANIEVVKSDKKGDFRIPSWFKLRPWRFIYTIRDYDPEVVIYKPGFKLHASDSASRTGFAEDMNLTSEQKREALQSQGINPARLRCLATDEEKLKNISAFESAISLGEWPIISLQRPKLEKAVVEQIESLAVTETEKNILKAEFKYTIIKRR